MSAPRDGGLAASLSDDLLLVCGEVPAGADALLRVGGPAGDGLAVVRDTAALDAVATADLRAVATTAGLWPRAERHHLLEALNGLLCEPRPSARLAASLHAVREVLRERLPAAVLAPGAPHHLHVESLLRVDERSFLVRGWCDAEVGGLVAVSPEGGRTALEQVVFRYPRPDVVAAIGHLDRDAGPGPAGFVAFFETDSPSVLADGWVLELHAADGDGIETSTAVHGEADVDVRTELLRLMPLDGGRADELRRLHLRPAVARLQDARARSVRIEAVEDFGTPPGDPAVSIIVPLYERLEFVEHQVLHFAIDEDIAAHEVIYVLDSPALADKARRLLRELHALHRLPLRLVVLSANGGFATANNLGASVARGRRLLLLNSDVVPSASGWVRAMQHFFDETPGIGALGPKLLFEDDGLQHAGLFFRRPPHEASWYNDHFFKGLHRTLPAANVARPVPAITAACMLVDAGLFHRLGGLSTAYVQGDYEDSDLCLRIREAGLECWYLPDVELFHLEGQSYPNEVRALSSEYNRWLHTTTWDRQITEAMREFEAGHHG